METERTEDARRNFFSIAGTPFKFRWFLVQKLPAALFSGVRVRSADEEKCVVSIPYKWFTKNPFRSTYFACLSMAAEMSTGILAMGNVYGRSPKVALLVVAVEGKFFKKATGLTAFTCVEGQRIRETVDAAIRMLQPQSIRVLSTGYNSKGELVAEFWITWSFKVRS